MSTALTTTSAGGPERFANPLRQIQGVMAQPAVRRTAPMALMVGLIGAAALAWTSLSTPPQKTLFSGLADADKAAVVQSLEQASITAHVDDGTGAITVDEDAYSKARMLLASQGLPKAAPGGYAILDQLPMGVSRAVEGERLRQARETELARSIQDIDAVAEARVHLATPEASVFVRDKAEPTASVIVKLNAGRSLSDAQVSSIINLVASSVPGMKPDSVTIVDQAGALLTKPGGRDALGAAGDERLDVQNRVEDKYRQQLTQLLTPLLGAGNFSAEVQADVNLDETQATRESYEKQGALRAETGNWTGNQASGGQAPGGIPGALSNTPPPASTLQVPTPAVGASGGPQPVAGGPAPDAAKQSDSYQRAYDLGREVSVTRAAPGSIKRLSVAVVLREPDKGRRTAMEITQITDLVKSAVGYDANRQDQVTVISKKFAGSTDAVVAPAWYDNAWLPMVARNLTAVVIVLLVLLLGVRPLAKSLMKKRDDAMPGAAQAGAPLGALGAGVTTVGPDGVPVVTAPVSLDQMENSRGYDERIGAVRGFTRDNPARAALAVRDMIKADAK
ncbi:flagellar M-ring protein FliF [Microvirga sp. SRT01]|uniref:Flagellar M-ring protein n=1 Tax=Sphingomonas longa TaxID=2778730 RepID=A0ABS2DCA9_9SPHN|nr:MULTISPECIES: flagellar basal-body MS-ring/collar protein FliF [Alphaproteobacteria]MBM6578133.1 flagellar M-ring protein FliF [Sphingomonas sp. BT552]MBR7711174.1 flagellar M-ring protein FliF [Microvirga sp. SRT01]